MARGKRKSEHYVNNKEFLEALINYRAKCQRAEEAGAVSYTHLRAHET